MAGLPFKYSLQYPEKVIPDNVCPKEGEEDKCSFEIIHKSEAEDLPPLIILLGWAGCQEKHLDKYVPMYTKKGFIVMTVIVPPSTLFFQSSQMGVVALRLVGELVDKQLSSHPIFFHVFSNGGTMVYVQINNLCLNPDSPFKAALSVRGIIFDSAPGKRRILNAVKAFMSLQTSPVQRYGLGLVLLLYLIIVRVMVCLFPCVRASQQGFELYSRVCQDAAPWPQLFLYSKADRVILAEDVEEAMAQRKDRGVEVKSICWDDSLHVAHLKEHPEVYSKACTDFIAGCLAARPVKASA